MATKVIKGCKAKVKPGSDTATLSIGAEWNEKIVLKYNGQLVPAWSPIVSDAKTISTSSSIGDVGKKMSRITVSVMNKNMASDDIVGTAIIPLSVRHIVVVIIFYL